MVVLPPASTFFNSGGGWVVILGVRFICGEKTKSKGEGQWGCEKIHRV